MASRREFVAGALVVAPALITGAHAQGSQSAMSRLDALERRHGGRLGFACLDLATGARLMHRGDERFAMCSTFKFLAAACVLARVDRGEESLSRPVAVRRADLVPYSPVTERYADLPGLTMGEVCRAAITVSDNTAGNLMLDSFGGPAGLTAFLRSLGDDATRLDRREPQLNEARPGDPRDTTTPAHMVRLLQSLLLGETLSAGSRAQLVTWMEACETGLKMLRAGAPSGWRAADKTGSGEQNVRNQVAVFFPPDRAPVLIAAFYAESRASDAERNAVFVELACIATGR